MPDDRPNFEINLDVGVGRNPRALDASHIREESVFRLAICGDFSGRTGVTSARPDAQGHWRVDRDDFDSILATIAPTVRVPLGSGVVADVRIRELDDFHPDQLYRNVSQFEALRTLRAELADPATFRKAAAQLATAPAPDAPTVRPNLHPTGSLLESIVGEELSSAPSGAGSNDLYEFIQRSMAPYLVARADPRQAELLAQVDVSIEAVMRALLHHTTFQSIESLWRGVFRMVRAIDTSAQLQIYLFDMTREELVADLHGAITASETSLYRRLNDRAPVEDGGWGALVAHFAFGSDAADIDTLAMVAEVGRALDAPWLAESHPDLATGKLPEQAASKWRQLRAQPSARYLALALPRVLLRLPFGNDTDPIEHFAFEELERPDAHGSYLWGNPALFCATLLAEGFAERGSGLAPGAQQVVSDLPLHLIKRDGHVTSKPCAEVVMGEDDAMALLEAGIIPMLCYRDQDIVRVARIQSVAEPLARLSGRANG